jgi:hypothetical protein
MAFIASVVALAAWVWGIIIIRRKEVANRKVTFERTNSAGVVEWESFDQMRAHEREQFRLLLLTIVMFFPGALVPLLSLLMILSTIFSWF